MNETDRDWVIKYFERVISDQDRRTEQALIASRDAVDKAEKAQERRLDLLNEFRAQSADEGRKYALRDSVEDRLSKLETNIARLYGGLAVVAFVGIANLIRIWSG